MTPLPAVTNSIPDVIGSPLIPEALNERTQLALLHRVLHRIGFDDGTRSGHMSMRCDDGTLLVSPHQYAWNEMRASYIAHIDHEGTVLDGECTVSIVAKSLHLALHKARPDIRIGVHNHPRWATVWAAAHRIPPVYDQLSGLVRDDLVLYDDFNDNVASQEIARANVAAMTGSTKALLANHGVFVVADSVRQAHLRCVSLEHRCRLAWKVELLGGGQPVRPEVIAALAPPVEDSENGWPHFLESAFRLEIAKDSTVLS
jgi:ribulose-5-phosphate 4-epimerase/fuculose-1-phosphate aldolase